MFNDDATRRRRQNLGGSSTATSSTQVLQNARQIRAQREDLRRREEAALSIQSAIRGFGARLRAREERRSIVDNDADGSVEGLRCLWWLAARMRESDDNEEDERRLCNFA